MIYHLGNIDDLIQSGFSDAQPEIFQGRGGFVKLGTPINISSNIPEKKAPQGKILKFFLWDTLKTTFWLVNLT